MTIGSLNNLAGLMSLRQHMVHRAAISRSFSRLASGYRVNTGADDPAGLIAAESLNATLRTLDAETRANERAISIADTADGAIGEISGLLTQAKALVAANANTAGLSAEEKAANQLEIDSILDSVDRISSTTRFNGQRLLDGSAVISASGSSLTIASTHSTALGRTSIEGKDYALNDLRGGGKLDTSRGASASASTVIDKAITDVATLRGRVGAYSRHTLQSNLSVLAAQSVNLTGALSIIRDTNFASESLSLSRSGILARSALLTGRLISVFA